MKDQIMKDLKDSRYSIRALSDDMNVCYDHLLRVLRGERSMSYMMAVKLCESLNKLTSNTYHLTDFGY